MTGKQFIKSYNTPHHVNHIAFVHHKGGTGKTTACLNIAGWLTKMNQKVLVVDLDPQANATTGLGVDLKSIENSMYDVLLNRANINEIILETDSGVYLAPATLHLLSLKSDSATILKDRLRNLHDFFDFVLFDSPPGSTFLMMNSIVAAKNIIIPLDTGVFGFETLETLKTLILTLEEELRITIHIRMALLKVFSSSLLQQSLTKKIQKMIIHYFSENGLQNCPIIPIPFSKKVCLAQMKGLPISHYAPSSQVGTQYQQIANTILRESRI